MARPHKYDKGQVFTMPDDQTRPIESLKGVPPSVRGKREIMASDEKRKFASQVIGELRKSWVMPKVNSNRELMERIDQYFEMVQHRAVPPTLEELSLYCGYTSTTVNDWQSGRLKGFQDDVMPGVTTAAIVKKAKELLHAFDAVMAETGQINFLAYCFRSKNYYGMTDKQEIAIAPDNGLKPPMTPEEIAKNLPDVATFKADGEVE